MIWCGALRFRRRARIVTASDDRTARIWDAAIGAEITALRGHEDGVNSVAFSPMRPRCHRLRRRHGPIWDAATGAEIATLRGHEAGVRSAEFSPDGARIVTASDDRTARLWAPPPAPRSPRCAGTGLGESAAFSPDGARIVTASNGPHGPHLGRRHRHRDRRHARARGVGAERRVLARRHPHRHRLIDHTARIWDAATGAEIAALRGHEGRVQSAAFSPDGARIVTASGTARPVSGTPPPAPRSPPCAGTRIGVRSAAFSPDGARIVTASWDRTARIWDAATGAEIAALRGHEGWVLSAAFSPDGARIVTASGDRTARIWDAATGTEIAALRGHEDRVESAAFSPDGARIVTASDDGTARIWDAATGAEIAALRGHEDGCGAPRSRPTAAASSPPPTTAPPASGTPPPAPDRLDARALRGHEAHLRVRSAAFSPDGARIVTASDDRTARIWDAATGAEIARMTLDAGVFALSVHGTAIALGDALGRIHVFDAEDFLG